MCSKAENCSGFPHEKAKDSAFDMDCREKFPTLCQVFSIQNSVLSSQYLGTSFSNIINQILFLLKSNWGSFWPLVFQDL